MSVKTKLNKAVSIVVKDGPLSLAIKVFTRYILPFILLPATYFRIKKIHWNNVPELVSSIFSVSNGYVAPMQIRSEITGLIEHINKTKPKVIMEIGTARGGVLFLLCKTASPGALIISLDLPGGKQGGYPVWKKPLYRSFAEEGQEIFLIKGNSHADSSLELVKKVLNGRPVDFLFIDADHTYEGVKRDFEIYSPLIRSGGEIGFHDIYSRGHSYTKKAEVDRFWEEIKAKYPYKEFIAPIDEKVPSEIRSAGIGVLTKN